MEIFVFYVFLLTLKFKGVMTACKRVVSRSSTSNNLDLLIRLLEYLMDYFYASNLLIFIYESVLFP